MVQRIMVCLEIGPESTGAFVPSCPGCWVFGRTPESAMKKVKFTVSEWYEWLQKHGENDPVEPKAFDVEVGEMLTVDYNPVEAGKPEPLFWSEVPPISRKDVRRTIRLMSYSREDLLELVEVLDEESLDRHPPNKPRTIRNCLKHIAYVELWYITRLDSSLPSMRGRSVTQVLARTREVVLDYLKDFPREKMRGVFQPKRDPSPVCNLWTARKVLRRLVDHERLHTRYIERLLMEWSAG